MGIAEIENEIVDEFSFFTDWQDKYEYIIEVGKKLKGFPDEKERKILKLRDASPAYGLQQKRTTELLFLRLIVIQQ